MTCKRSWFSRGCWPCVWPGSPAAKIKEETAAEPTAAVTETPAKTPAPKPTAAVTATPAEEPADLLPEGMVYSYLTGEPVPEEIGRRRPAAVMINNIEACLPHWGLSHAGVYYEAPVEGGISRIMAIFEDYDSVERIGSVRSCRNYFIFTPPALKRFTSITDSPPTRRPIWNFRRSII